MTPRRAGLERGTIRPRAGGILTLMAFAALVLSGPAAADDFRTPAISVLHADWRAALDQLKRETAAEPAARDHFSFGTASPDPVRVPALTQLNVLAAPFFPRIAQSPAPVLLPFDAALLVADRAGGADGVAAPRYQAGFRTAVFDAGPAGYDAVFALDRGAVDDIPPWRMARPAEVHITGSALVYDIEDAAVGKGEPVRALAALYPDLRRVIREGFVRYAFTRFGIPYVVSISCFDGAPRLRRLSCREAAPIAERFLRALHVAGGRPAPMQPDIASVPVERPQAVSPDFTYRPPGEIIPGSGYRNQPGRADFTAYAQIRFPLEAAPAFANSQSFLNWGDCYRTGRVGWSAAKGSAYHCKRNDKPLVFDEGARENYSYPWQDNFCETRDFEVGQCATGMGHQGQDIRPARCVRRDDGADRCVPNLFPVVAVRDGVLIRAPQQQAPYLLVNTGADHIRFRYMHMDPRRLDADGVLHGRRVAEGERIGVVSNYQDYPGGTTSHLHFDVQVFTRDGWVWVNPYVTLITAYERLIGGRGRDYVAPPAFAHAPEVTPATPHVP